MGTIKTTVKLESSALPFPVNYTTSVSNVVVASNYARVSITDDAPVTLSNIQFGTEGGFLYAQSPTTNTFGTIVNIWLIDGSGDREIASLNPGEAILLPLAPSQQGIYATTNLGKTASLDYNVSDKGGKWGQSTFVLFDNNANWEYSVIDVNVNQTPKIVDTGVSTSGWIRNRDWIIQDKGYVIEFYNSGDVKYLLVDSRGNIVENSIPLGAGTGVYEDGLEGKTWAKVYSVTGTAETVTVFDGDHVYTHSFEGADAIYIDSSYDWTTADGSFIVYAENYNGTVYEEFVDSNFLINGENRYLLTSINYGSGPKQYQYAQSYVYQFANFVAVRVYNDDNSQDLSYKVFDTSGILLQDLDVSTLAIIGTDLYFYGDNTLQLISSSDLNGGRNFMFNYNHELNRLLGTNFEWSVSNDYEYYVTSYNKSLDNGFREPYEPNGIAITFYTDDNSAGWAYLNQYSEDCQIHYLAEGMTTFSVYTPSKPIWFSKRSDGLFATRTNVFFVWGNTTGATISTPLNLLALNSSLYTVQNIDTNSVTLISDFKTAQVGNGHVGRYPAGNEYLVHEFRADETLNSYIVVAKKGLVRTLTMTNGDYNWGTAYNCIFVYGVSDNYGTTSFYYDFKQNTFVNLNQWYYYNTFPSSYGTYNTGEVKTIGNKLFLFNYNGNSARVLNSNNVTLNKALPTSSGWTDYILGYDFITWLDFQPSTQSWVIYIYDTDLTLLSTYDTGYVDWNDTNSAGSRILLEFYDGNENHYLWVSKKGVVKTNTEYDSYRFNDYNWWND